MSLAVTRPQPPQSPIENTVEISVKGKWIRVPALDVAGQSIIVRGRWPRIALIHDEIWLENEVADPELYVKSLRQCGLPALRADIFTFTQKLPATAPKYPYPVEWDSIAAIRVASFKQWWDSLPQESRKNVRRSQKRGVTVQLRMFDDQLIKDIMELNNDSKLRQGVLYSYYGRTFEETKKGYSAFLNRSEFICAYFGEELIGLAKLVYRGDIAAILTFVPKVSHSDKRPANALLAKAVELCESKGLSHLTYGMYNYGNKGHSPLREFKVRNGFEEMLVPRYHIPLTTKGKLCMKLKLHRGFVGILPHSVISFRAMARAKWYQLREELGGRNKPV
ncbi:MAG TPA: hypothetical protein VOA41_06610 [Candidatus Dormibacteraeota bacterium]|nr:hypothetical protein [Candidatus Dormibacteraeota bacterium]